MMHYVGKEVDITPHYQIMDEVNAEDMDARCRIYYQIYYQVRDQVRYRVRDFVCGEINERIGQDSTTG